MTTKSHRILCDQKIALYERLIARTHRAKAFIKFCARQFSASSTEQCHRLFPSSQAGHWVAAHKRSPRLSCTRRLAAAAQRPSADHQNIPDCFHSPLAGYNCDLGLPEVSREEQWGCFRSMIVQREHQCIEQAHVLVVVLRQPSQSHGMGLDLVYDDGVR